MDTGMTLPFQPMTLTFTDMHYFVKCPPVSHGSTVPSMRHTRREMAPCSVRSPANRWRRCTFAPEPLNPNPKP